MNHYVIDTQALVKHLCGNKVINDKIDTIMKGADNGENIIIIPSVVIFEIGYLEEKKRIPVSLSDIENILNSSINYIEERLSIDIIKASFGIKDIPELHDRLIAGTSSYLKIPLLTNDPEILNSRYVNCIK